MISLFQLAYRKIEPLGATPGEVSLMIDLLADDLGVRNEPTYMVTDDQREAAFTPGSRAERFLSEFI